MAASSTNEARQAALSLAEQAEAEAAEAAAEAAAARALAAELQAREGTDPTSSAKADAMDATADTESEATEAEAEAETTVDEVDSQAEDEAEDYDEVALDAASPRNWRSLTTKVLAVAAPILVLCGLLAASGWFIWTSHHAAQDRARTAEFSAAARQGVVNLMSLDFNHGDADIQRLIDSTTGQFREDFEKSKNDFITVMKESKVVTEANVKATGVEKMTGDSATVLVAATSQVSNAASAQQQPRAWRLSVDLTRDNGQLKMSKVEFVP